MTYSDKQMEYINSVDGNGHMSAVKIIGEMEAENIRLNNFNEDSASFNLGFRAAVDGKSFESGYDNHHNGYDYEIWEMGWLWCNGKDILAENKRYKNLIRELYDLGFMIVCTRIIERGFEQALKESEK